jgi:hypothetical protein
MPLTIGQLKFDFISGPTSFTVLNPVSKLYKKIPSFVPTLILVGDEHTDRMNSTQEQEYESVLSYTLETALSENRSYDSSKLAYIGGVDVLKILALVFNDPEECSHKIFDVTFDLLTKSSKLYKSIQAIQDEPAMALCMQMFRSYFVYVCKHDQELHKYAETIFKGIRNYHKDTKTLHEEYKYKQRSQKIHTRIPQEHKQNMRMLQEDLAEYNEACDVLATTIMMPFNEMFVLFSSWRAGHQSCLTLYNAGEAHCSHLRNFLMSQNLYTGIVADAYAQNIFQSKQVLKQKWTRCLDVSQTDVNVDNFLIENMVRQNLLLPTYQQKLNLAARRIQILGLQIYKEMLSGRLLSKEELEEKCTALQKIDSQCLQDLQISSLKYDSAFLEYHDKKRI